MRPVGEPVGKGTKMFLVLQSQPVQSTGRAPREGRRILLCAGRQEKGATEGMLDLTSIRRTFTEHLPCARYPISPLQFHRSWKFYLRVFSRKKASFTSFFQPYHFSSLGPPSCLLFFGTWNSFLPWAFTQPGTPFKTQLSNSHTTYFCLYFPLTWMPLLPGSLP